MIQNRGFCILKVKRISPSLVRPLFLVLILFFFLSSLSHINYQKLMMTYMFATVLILILYKKPKCLRVHDNLEILHFQIEGVF